MSQLILGAEGLPADVREQISGSAQAARAAAPELGAVIMTLRDALFTAIAGLDPTSPVAVFASVEVQVTVMDAPIVEDAPPVEEVPPAVGESDSDSESEAA